MSAAPHPTLDRAYLRLGLAAMARAQEAGNGNFGHYGAGLLAAWFLSEEHAIDAAGLAGLSAQCERFIAQNVTFFVPYAAEAAPVDSERRLAAALETNIDRLCSIGHNVIFAAHALRALRVLGHGVGEAETASLCALVAGQTWSPTTVFEIDVSALQVAAMAPYADSRDLAQSALREMPKFDRIYQGFFAGWVGHILTMAHALIELERLGYPELARRGHRPHRLLATQAGMLHHYHGTGLTPSVPATASPLQAAFWNGDYAGNNWAYAHTFKYPLAYYAMRPSLEDAAERARIDAVLQCLWN